ncbi:putative rac gtpase [Hibiscus syriacus]|uniref:Rac gtpase n=1 Tax=Hibiscus syriacus TaxID=106335 RepID=A0A6A2YE24_HIBSY|nr:WUSCHEL-related homeobox 9-like [Hibiscus syriacus]KAE8674259.1 putative rac gtpase [Hibiscus syriacus]
MASSNRHWPSMFKSKPCNTHHQWQQHDINPSLISSACHRPPCSSGCEERTPEPKPRWNPKPEQIRILEAIFNSGMVNPPRDEIRKIKVLLQEYGQVGDANIFYWFQNRKSRSKPKLRNLQNTKQQQSYLTPSSSSHKSSPKGAKKSTAMIMDVSDSPSGSVNQTCFHQQPQTEFLNEPFVFPMQQGPGLTQEFAFPEQPIVGPCTSLLLSEILNHEAPRKEHEEKMLMQLQLSYSMTNNAPPATVPSHSHHSPGVGELGAVDPGCAAVARSSSSTVFINDVAFEMAVGPFNVREAFGDDAILIDSAGQPVLTNEWGITLQSLQHGGFYYLLRSSTPFSV